MADDIEFDDNDDILLNAFCTPPSFNTTLEKRFNEGTDENISVKRSKLNESQSVSPVIQLSRTFGKEKTIPSLPNATKRIFPGPAGILSDENQIDVFSQDTSSFFQDGPWKEMSKDFKISNSLYLYDKFNIAWTKKEAIANKFVNQKAPFLAGILLSLEVSEGHTQKSINITLKDMTGSIQGTILQNLYEEYASHFTLGSVLVLVQFGILSCTCDKCDNHHLTITPKNLSAIYSGNERIVIKGVEPENVLKEYCQRKKEIEVETKNKSLLKQNTLNKSPIIPSIKNRCMYNTNRNIDFQRPCTSRNIFSPSILNKSADTTETMLPKSSSTSENFLLPKYKTMDKGNSETNPSNNLTNLCNSSSSKKLFSFRKVETSHKSSNSVLDRNKTDDISPELNSSSSHKSTSTLTINNSFPSDQVDCNSIKNSKETKGEKNVKIRNSQISVKVDKVEHEKIWKDILEDVDINSFFDDEF